MRTRNEAVGDIHDGVVERDGEAAGEQLYGDGRARDHLLRVYARGLGDGDRSRLGLAVVITPRLKHFNDVATERQQYSSGNVDQHGGGCAVPFLGKAVGV